MNTHLVGGGQADDAAGAADGFHLLRKVEADFDGRADGNGSWSLDEEAFDADIDGFAFNFLAAETQLHLRAQGHAAGATALMLNRTLCGADQAQQTVLVDGLVEKTARTSFEALSHGVWARVR